MRVACFCGEQFAAEETFAVCPRCGEPADLPHVSEAGPEAVGARRIGGWRTRLATRSSSSTRRWHARGI